MNVDDYREILLGRNSKLDVARRMEMVKDFPLFKGLQESVIHQIVLRSATRYYSHSDAIITEGRLNGGIFFLISGTVQVQKTMSAKQLAATTTSSKQTRGNIHSDGPQISTIVRRLMDMEERIDETETANNNDFGVRKRSIAKSRSSKSGSRDSVSASSRRTANTNNASFNVNNSNLRKSQALGEKQIDSEIANSRKALKIRQQPVAPLNGISDDMSSVHYSKPDQTSKIIDYEDAVVFELARLHPGQCFPGKSFFKKVF